jgi:hypothetical protein
MVSRPSSTTSGVIDGEAGQQLLHPVRACAATASRPRKGMFDFSFTAQPRPASIGVWSGPMSAPQAR